MGPFEENEELQAGGEGAGGEEPAPEMPEGSEDGSTPEMTQAAPEESNPYGFDGLLFNIPPQLKKLEMISDEEFWHSAAAAKRKRPRPSVPVIILAAMMVIVMGFTLIVIINGKGWLLNLISGDNYMEFTLPIAEAPEADRALMQEDGRYTAEGLAEAASPSVVALEMYKEEFGFVPFSQGSGIIMTSDGYVITNAHVVEGAEKIKAVLYDGTEYSAKLVGADKPTDIAVIKLSAADLKPAVFGDSSALHIGEEVVAIGSPAGFYGSVTKGVVSGLDRKIRVEEYSTTMSCIQIDAAINPGNSGGALFNMWGQVVGITSSKLASSEYDGIGFAISMEEAKPIIEQLVEKGYTAGKPRVGITFYAISEETAEMNGTVAGLMIVAIDPTCDIANTELRENDTIVMLDGIRVTASEQVADIMKDKKPGDTMTARISRQQEDGTFTEFDISFELMEDNGTFVEKEEQ